MEDDVREALARFLLEAATAAVVVVAPDGRVVEANLSAIKHELDLPSLFAQRSADVPLAPFLRELRELGKASTVVTSVAGNAFRLEGRKSGELLVVEARESSVTSPAHLAEELAKLRFQASLGVAAATLMHDLNNLLAPILITSSRLARELEEGSMGTMATIIQTSASLAAALTRDVLALARPRAPMIQRFSVNDAVLEIRPLLERLLGEDTELVLELDPNAGDVSLDERRLEHALLNLVVNARDALPSGGRITLSTRATTGVDDDARPQVLLAVSDTGVGMTDEVRARACETFFTTKGDAGGLGLGLTSVQMFAAECGAKLSIESAPMKGTTVSMLLDRLPAVSPLASEPSADATPSRGDGEMILVADPDERVRTSIRLVLEREGYRPVLASTQDATLERAAADPVRIAVIDDRLMRSDPRTFFHRLRALRPKLRLIVMSDAPGGDAAPATVALLAKAFTGEDLLRAIRRALDGPAIVPPSG